MTEKHEFKLGRIGVVMLGVRDLSRAVAFYRDTLGLVFRSETPEFAFFDAGGVTLCLSQPLARAAGQQAGATEVVFSVEDVRGAYAALRAKGIRFTQEPRNVTGSFWAANFEDPDGHKLSVFGPEGSA